MVDAGRVAPRQADGELHPLVAAGQRGHVGGVLLGREDLFQQAGQLHLPAEPLLVGDLAHVRIGKGGYFVILSADRIRISHPEPRRILEQLPPGASLTGAALHVRHAQHPAQIGGQMLRLAFTRPGDAEAQAGRMKQPLRMWVLWPR